MSHFSVNVIIPSKVFNANPKDENVTNYISSQLQKFNENLETPRYVKYTKQELINKNRKEVDDYKKSTYAEFLKDKVAYEKGCNNEHMNYLKNEFPKKLTFTDDEHYADAIKYYEPEEIGEDGEVYSEYNPNSKWDWFRIGGRWAGWLTGKEKELETDNGFNFHTPQDIEDNSCDIQEAIEKKLIPFAIITPDGEWHEKAEMGWFGITSNENDDWQKEAIEIYDRHKNDYVVSIDCHI